MAKQDYIPAGINPFMVWHDQFKTQVLGLAGTFGLLPADTTPISGDNVDYHTKVTNATSVGNAAKMATADLATSRATAEKRARALAGRIKKHPAYTAAYGALLGIEGPEDATDLTTSKPKLTSDDHTGGVVEIGFNKSTSDGVNIYSKRDGDADFIFLARDTQTPYVDNRPLLTAGKPEIREYKAVFMLNDAEIGLFSDELVVNCAP